MAKKKKDYSSSMKEALESFDLKIFMKWVKKHNKVLYPSFSALSEKTQMATMCKMICNRTDLLNSEAHKKAIKWLKENNMKGEIF